MVHTILINSDNTITKRMNGAIMHRSTGVDSLRILVDPVYMDSYGDLNMIDCNCVMEIVTPISRTYIPMPLTPSQELYKNKVEYSLPIDITLTKEFGELEFKFIFTKLEMNEEGNFIERVRETLYSSLSIVETKRWNDYISSSDLSYLAEIMLTTQSKIEYADASIDKINATKIDDIVLNKETNEIYGVAEGQKVGTGINLGELGDEIAEETENGLIKVITDEEITLPDNVTGETASYSLYVNHETDELCLVVNGKVVSTITTHELGESIVDSTSEGLNEVIL